MPLTDFKDILGYDIRTSATRGRTVFRKVPSALALGVSDHGGHYQFAIRQVDDCCAGCGKPPTTVFGIYRPEMVKLFAFRGVSHYGWHCWCASMCPQVGIHQTRRFAPGPTPSKLVVLDGGCGSRKNYFGPIIGAFGGKLGQKSWIFTGAFPRICGCFALGACLFLVTLPVAKRHCRHSGGDGWAKLRPAKQETHRMTKAKNS